MSYNGANANRTRILKDGGLILDLPLEPAANNQIYAPAGRKIIVVGNFTLYNGVVANMLRLLPTEH
jgi:hypothetical protein